MTPENDNLDNIRKTWADMGQSLDAPAINNTQIDRLNNMKTALDRLRDKYNTFSIIALMMTFVSWMIFSKSTFAERPWNLWLGIAYASYFLICFVMDHWLYCGIKSINPLTMSISQVAQKAVFYKKRHLQFVAVFIPLGVTLIIFTGWVCSADPYFLDGMISGAIIGLAIGIIQFRRFMSCYRELSE